MTPYDRVLFARRGMHVRRFHVMPSIGEETVAHHSAGVAILIVLLHPDPSAKLLKAALTHDLNEWVLGDVPAQVKWTVPAVADAWAQLEQDTDRQWGLVWDLTPDDQMWLTCCDTLDLMFHCMEQMRMGNRYFKEVWERGLQRLAGKLKPEPVADLILQLTRNFVP